MILTFALLVINTWINFLPNIDTGITSTMTIYVSYFQTMINAIAYFAPLDTLYQIIGIILVIEVLLAIIKLTGFTLRNITLGIFKK